MLLPRTEYYLALPDLRNCNNGFTDFHIAIVNLNHTDSLPHAIWADIVWLIDQ